MSNGRTISSIAIALGIALALNGNATAQSTYYAPHGYTVSAPQRVMHNYVYYPSSQVYYAPTHRVWYWFDGYRWQNAYTLPRHIRVDFRLDGIPITLRSALPYREHHYVDSYYGRPWRAQHYRQHERREWRERRENRGWHEPGRGYPRHDFQDDRYSDDRSQRRW